MNVHPLLIDSAEGVAGTGWADISSVEAVCPIEIHALYDVHRAANVGECPSAGEPDEIVRKRVRGGQRCCIPEFVLRNFHDVERSQKQGILGAEEHRQEVAERPGGVQVRRLGNRQSRHFGQLIDENVVLYEVPPELVIRERTGAQLRDKRMVRCIGP